MQDEDTLSTTCEADFVVKPLGSHLNPTHALCPSCNDIYPIKMFKAKSTHAQAKAWGYKRAVEYVTEKCRYCRKPPKPISQLSMKEIRNRITSGDIQSGAISTLILEKKKAQLTQKKRLAVEKRWRAVRSKAWKDLQTQSTPEYTRIRKRVSELKIDTPEMVAFFTAYRQAIVLVRDFFRLEKTAGRCAPDKGKEWHNYIPPQTLAILLELWCKIPFTQRHGFKQPAITKPKLTINKE